MVRRLQKAIVGIEIEAAGDGNAKIFSDQGHHGSVHCHFQLGIVVSQSKTHEMIQPEERPCLTRKRPLSQERRGVLAQG
jgi:hypothetical protein